jgi:hypothetical protein
VHVLGSARLLLLSRPRDPRYRNATHPSASLDDAGARFRHLGGLQRTLGTNGSRSSGARVSSERTRRRLGRSLLAHCDRQHQ